MTDSDRRRRLEALFCTHAPAVRAYAARRTEMGAADDITSDVFVIAWRRLDDVPVDALPWLLACARRVVANRRRTSQRQMALRERLSRERPPAPPAATGDSALSEALRALRPNDREVLMLIAWEGLDAAQAATVIGCSRRALAMRLHRARRRLAAALATVDPAWTDPMEAI